MLNQRLVGALDDTGHGCVISQPMPELKKGHVLVKERIRAHIRELKSRIEELKALLEPQSNDNAE